jgi:hypothetical protein
VRTASSLNSRLAFELSSHTNKASRRVTNGLRASWRKQDRIAAVDRYHHRQIARVVRCGKIPNYLADCPSPAAEQSPRLAGAEIRFEGARQELALFTSGAVHHERAPTLLADAPPSLTAINRTFMFDA